MQVNIPYMNFMGYSFGIGYTIPLSLDLQGFRLDYPSPME